MALSDDLRQILVRAVTAESRAMRRPAPGDLAHHRARQKPSAALVGEGVLDFASITSEAMVVSHGYHVSVKVEKPPDMRTARGQSALTNSRCGFALCCSITPCTSGSVRIYDCGPSECLDGGSRAGHEFLGERK